MMRRLFKSAGRAWAATACCLAAVLAMARGDAHSAVELYATLCEVAPENPGCFACLAGATSQSVA